MKMSARILSAICGALIAQPLAAQVLLNFSWNDFGGSSSLAVPDHNATGVSDTRSLLTEFGQILHIDVFYEAASDFNGDIYLTLQHGSSQAILLNRPGRTASAPFGFDDSGFRVTLSDTAASGDIHTYRAALDPSLTSPLTGTWQPDGRAVDPALSLDTSARTAMLSVFNGKDVNGDWTLFAADLSSGGNTQILSWGLQITVVPEPDRLPVAMATALIAAWLWKRKSLAQ